MGVKYAVVRNATGIVFMSGIAIDFDHVTAPEGMTAVELSDDSPIPRPDYDHVDLETGDITDLGVPLFILKQQKANALRVANNTAIRTGFFSEALGASHKYPAEDQDQVNMQRVAIAAGALWCFASGAWAFETHTAAQGAQVLSDFGAACDSARANLATKLAAVDAAETIEAVAAVTW